MELTHTQLARIAEQDRRAAGRTPAQAAESYGRDVQKMIDSRIDLDLVQLYAHIAAHFAGCVLRERELEAAS